MAKKLPIGAAHCLDYSPALCSNLSFEIGKMPSFVGCIAELHVVNRRFPGSLAQDPSVAGASLAALLWPLPATQSLSPFAFPLPGWRGIFKRWLREDPQSKIRFIFKIILNSQLTKYHLSFYFWLQKGTQTERSDFTTGLPQEWLWAASHWAFLSIFFLKCLVEAAVSTPWHLLMCSASEIPAQFFFRAEFCVVLQHANT